MDQNTYMVNVKCMTYNHASFIEDTLNGFTMQETTFPFVCTIMDDASTDGEQDVIKEYLQEHFDLGDKSITCNKETTDFVFVFARHKTNHNCFFALYFLKYNHYGTQELMQRRLRYASEWTKKSKYIAICEGDDYWTDPQKLQKQVDFLESHPEYVICSHDFLEYLEQQKQFKDKSRQEDFLHKELKQGASYCDYSLGKYFDHWFTQPLTCLFRNGDYLQAIPMDRYNYFRDYILYYYILKEGKGALLQDVMGVYRVNNDGIWSSMSGIEQLKIVICDAYNIYSVEGDGRALNKMDNCEKEVVYRYYLSKDYRHILKELREYRKMVPLKHFFSFVLSVLKKIHHN